MKFRIFKNLKIVYLLIFTSFTSDLCYSQSQGGCFAMVDCGFLSWLTCYDDKSCGSDSDKQNVTCDGVTITCEPE